MNLRPTTLEDVSAMAAIHRLAAAVPPAHAVEDDVGFVRDYLMRNNQTWVAEVGGEVVGYVAFSDDWVSHLFVHPHHQGQGHGHALLAHVMADGRERQLWTFQSNAQARTFYENRGWVAQEFTDGQGNGEKEPDVRYAWRR